MHLCAKIHFEGRKDSQVKIRGHRVDLSEIEKHLFEVLGVKRRRIQVH